MNFLKYLALLFLVPDGCEEQIMVSRARPKSYDAVRFNQQFDIDTSECWIYGSGRVLSYVLSNEVAIVQKNKYDTFLSVSKYSRLSVCRMPTVKLIPGDTIIVSGLIYGIAGNEMGRGFPTILTSLSAKKY